MSNLDISKMQAEVYEWACSKGWEPDPDRTFDDECALIHSEISEILEAYRIHKTAYYTDENGKPDDVPSEIADVLIHMLHYSACDRFQLDGLIKRYMPDSKDPSFCRKLSTMHHVTSGAWEAYPYNRSIVTYHMRRLLSLLLDMCDDYGYDLAVEYRRKMDYNITRAYRHGNKVM